MQPASYLSKIINKKSPIPILACAKSENSFLTATNLDLALQLKTELPDGMYNIIGNDFVLDKNMAIDDFPVIPEVNGKLLFEITTENLLTGLKKTIAHVAKKDTCPELEGVFIKSIGGGTVVFTGTQSHHLSQTTQRAKVSHEQSFILANPQKVASVIPALGDLITVHYEKTKLNDYDRIFIKFTGKHGTIFARAHNGEYPDYLHIFPKFTVQMACDAKELKQAFKALLPYAKNANQKWPQIEMATKVDFNEIEFSCHKELDNIHKIILVAINGYKPIKSAPETAHDGVIVMPIKNEEEKTIYNITYLIKALQSLDDGMVYLCQTDTPSKSPLLLTNTSLNE